MRPHVVVLLTAALVAGCLQPSSLSRTACGGAATPTETAAREDPPRDVKLWVMNDNSAPTGVCVRLDDRIILDETVPGNGGAAPGSLTTRESMALNDTIHVSVSLDGTGITRSAYFETADFNHVIVVLSEDRISIHHQDHEPLFH